MKKIRVGIMTMSDGRQHIHDDMLSVNRSYQTELAAALEATGKFEVVEARRRHQLEHAGKGRGRISAQAGR